MCAFVVLKLNINWNKAHYANKTICHKDIMNVCKHTFF